MFGLGIPELIVIFVIALIVFGPRKLPDLGKSIGRAMAEFKKASDDFQESIRTEMKDVENSAKIEEVQKLTAPENASPHPDGSVDPASDQAAEQKERQPEQNTDQKSTGEAF